MLKERGLGWITDYNPIAAMLDMIRGPVLEARAPSAQALSVACLTVTAFACGAALLLSRCQRRLIFQL